MVIWPFENNFLVRKYVTSFVYNQKNNRYSLNLSAITTRQERSGFLSLNWILMINIYTSGGGNAAAVAAASIY